MVLLLLTHVFFLSFLGFTVQGQESLLRLVTLHRSSTPATIPAIASHIVGVSVSSQNLGEISASVINAEKWVRTHVLSHYPSTNITSIIVGKHSLCDLPDFEQMKLLLPSVRNIHYSLTRWGLQREIKVSVSLCSLDFSSKAHFIKPILDFLREINSTVTITPNFSAETLDLVELHSKLLKALGDSGMNEVNVVVKHHSISRKLAFADHFPAIPYPSSRIGNSVPSDAAIAPLPPLIGISSPPLMPFSLPFSPGPTPSISPPCNPSPGDGGGGRVMSPPPLSHPHQGVWCVAKPSVPSDKLQEALDYACGEGGADCAAIAPGGSCYSPDSLVAHASYAFNSYWQKKKRNGGTCGFEGTAMLITSDPSYLHCRFILS